jgi:integrase
LKEFSIPPTKYETEKNIGVKSRILESSTVFSILILSNSGTIKRVRSDKKFSLTFKDVDAIKKCEFTPDDGTTYHSWRMFLFACRTAFRISDVFDFRYRHINLTENGWVIVKKSVKLNGGTYRNNLSQVRDIFGDNIAEEVLMEYYKEEHGEDDYIFPRFSEETVKVALDKIQAQSDIQKNITFHIARHTCATQLAAKDVGLHKIMRIGGWNDPRTIRIYVDLADDLLGRY